MGENRAFFLLHLFIAIWSFSCISVKLPGPAYMNLKLPAAREEPPYPILNILHRNGIVRRAFSNPNSETLDSPRLKRNFPAEKCSRCSEAVLGFQRRSLCALITGDALNLIMIIFCIHWLALSGFQLGKTTDKGMEGVDKPHCPGLVPAW